VNDAELRLDGNAAAGLLSEVFAAEMTTALGTCAACGASSPVGAVHVYCQAPGTVLRCPYCTTVLMCVVRLHERLLVDMSGLRRVEVTPGLQ
jgi:hypothetical protein